jgi:hypothetical protein
VATNPDASRLSRVGPVVCLVMLCPLLVMLTPGRSLAGCGSGGGQSDTGATTGSSTLIVGVETAVQQSSGCEGTDPGVAEVRDSDLDALCVSEAITQGRNPFAFCDLTPDAAAAVLTPGVVAQAFRRLPLPQSELMVQPPGGATLVNFATNFYTEQGEFTRSVRLLGQRVDLKIWPSQFGWRFGDGRSLASASAGAPYPDLEITHEYATKGQVRPSVDTTYAAQFRVNGGPWRDVNGTVTIPGSPVQLQVRTATPLLVGYH